MVKEEILERHIIQTKLYFIDSGWERNFLAPRENDTTKQTTSNSIRYMTMWSTVKGTYKISKTEEELPILQ